MASLAKDRLDDHGTASATEARHVRGGGTEAKAGLDARRGQELPRQVEGILDDVPVAPRGREVAVVRGITPQFYPSVRREADEGRYV